MERYVLTPHDSVLVPIIAEIDANGPWVKAEEAEATSAALVAKCNELYNSREVIYRRLEEAEAKIKQLEENRLNVILAVDKHRSDMAYEVFHALCIALHP